jgi:hypothetical protein
MSQKINELTEALTGVLVEQKALQGYVVDFINAYNKQDPDEMLQSLKGAMTLCNMFLAEFTKHPGVRDTKRHVDRLVEGLGSLRLGHGRNTRRGNR